MWTSIAIFTSCGVSYKLSLDEEVQQTLIESASGDLSKIQTFFQFSVCVFHNFLPSDFRAGSLNYVCFHHAPCAILASWFGTHKRTRACDCGHIVYKYGQAVRWHSHVAMGWNSQDCLHRTTTDHESINLTYINHTFQFDICHIISVARVNPVCSKCCCERRYWADGRETPSVCGTLLKNGECRTGPAPCRSAFAITWREQNYDGAP